VRELTLDNPRIYLNPKGELNDTEIKRFDNMPKTSAPAYRLCPSGRRLAKMDLTGSDPYFEVRTLRGNVIHRSTVQMNTVNPKWDPFIISTKDVGFYEKFNISVIDWDANGKHDLIGSFTTSLYELSLGAFLYPLMRSKDNNRSEIIEYGKLWWI